jgi:serine/threonine protein kinase
MKATHRLSNATVAIKLIPKSRLRIGNAKVYFDNEVTILRELDHPLIVKYFELTEDADNYYMVMEYLPRGDLLTYVNSHPTVPEDESRRLFSQLLCAVRFLHIDRSIVHRDLKLENTLLDAHGNIRLIDFGFAKVCSSDQLLSSRCGSPAYVAPEIVTGSTYSSAVDIWSLGVILYALTTGSLPFNGRSIEQQLTQVVFIDPAFPPSMPRDLKDLLRGMLHKNPEARLKLNDVISHPWMRGMDIGDVVKPHQSGIDMEVVELMTDLGIDARNLSTLLRQEHPNDVALSYRMLARQCATTWREPPATPTKKSPPVLPKSPKSCPRPCHRNADPTLTASPRSTAGKENNENQANAIAPSPQKHAAHGRKSYVPGSPKKHRSGIGTLLNRVLRKT